MVLASDNRSGFELSVLFYCTVIKSKNQYIKTDKLLTYLLGLNDKAVNKYYLFY